MCHLKLDSRHLKPFQDRILGACLANSLAGWLEVVIANSFALSALIHLNLT